MKQVSPLRGDAPLSLTAVAHGGNHASSYPAGTLAANKSAKPPNGLAPQDRAASPPSMKGDKENNS